MSGAAATAAPSAADFRARHGGGGSFTVVVNQRVGSQLAVLAHRRGLSPTALTLTNLVLGLATGVAVAALADDLARRDVAPLVVGVGAFLLWELAYSFDCADGQLARVTGRTSPAGARVDVLSDVALQITLTAAISQVAVAEQPGTQPWLVAAFVGTWLVNLVTSILQRGAGASSLVTSTSLPVRLVKLSRDYGAILVVVGGVLAFGPQHLDLLMGAFALLNGGFLLASIGQAAATSVRPAAD